MSILLFKNYNKSEKLNDSINKYEAENKTLKTKIEELNASLNELQNGISNNLFPYKNKTCTYIETYEFIDYYDSKDSLLIIVDKELTKEAPLILILDPNKFKRDFIKNQSYEFTFKKTIFYEENTNEFIEKLDVIKIEPTDKKGMEQIDELCKFD